MVKATKLDYLFAAKSVSKEINNRVKQLEDVVKAEFLDEYEHGGTDRKRSTLYGKQAGWLTIREGKPSEHVTKFQLTDYQKAIDWFDAQRPETDGFAADFLELFCQWHFEHTGEKPDGCDVFEYDTEEGKPTAALTIKEKVVLPMLKDSEMSEHVSEFLLGDRESWQFLLEEGE